MGRILFAATAFVAVALLTASTAQASPVYEGFDYPAGSTLVGQNGGNGFAGGWISGGFNANPANDNDYVISSGSLSSPNLLTSGNRVSTGPHGTISGLTRNLASPLGTPGTTAYLSVLLRPDGTIGAGVFNGFFGIYLDSPVEPDIFIGKPGGGALGEYVVEDRGGGGQVSSGIAVDLTKAALLVLRADFHANSALPDKFTLYVNPGATEPSVGAVKNDSNAGTISAVTLYSTGAYSTDEIRIGNTFADVAPQAGAAAVPLPGALVPGMVGAFVAAGVRRRRAWRN